MDFTEGQNSFHFLSKTQRTAVLAEIFPTSMAAIKDADVFKDAGVSQPTRTFSVSVSPEMDESLPVQPLLDAPRRSSLMLFHPSLVRMGGDQPHTAQVVAVVTAGGWACCITASHHQRG